MTKVYGVELSEYEAQDVCKIFRSKKDAEYFAKIANAILKLEDAFMNLYGKIPFEDREMQIELSAGIGRDIHEMAETWEISDFFQTAHVREYELE